MHYYIYHVLDLKRRSIPVNGSINPERKSQLLAGRGTGTGEKLATR